MHICLPFYIVYYSMKAGFVMISYVNPINKIYKYTNYYWTNNQCWNIEWPHSEFNMSNGFDVTSHQL